nr:hypothetical protein [Dinghuibacter silviterrae]
MKGVDAVSIETFSHAESGIEPARKDKSIPTFLLFLDNPKKLPGAPLVDVYLKTVSPFTLYRSAISSLGLRVKKDQPSGINASTAAEILKSGRYAEGGMEQTTIKNTTTIRNAGGNRYAKYR